MEVDFNSFIGRWPYWENIYADPTGDALVRLMDRSSIKRAVVVSMRAIFDNVEKGNEETFKACERYPERLIPAITINPYSKLNGEEYLKSCRERGACILKLYPFNHSYSKNLLGEPDVDRLMKEATRMGYICCLPVRLFMNWGFNVHPASELVAFAERYPETTVVIDNMNYSEFTSLVDGALKNSNIFLGTTSETVFKGIEYLVEQLGDDRILGGTGAPLQIPECGIVKVEKALIEKESKAKILGGNAKKLLDVRLKM